MAGRRGRTAQQASAHPVLWKLDSACKHNGLAERLNSVPLEKVSLNLAEVPTGAKAEEADPSSVS